MNFKKARSRIVERITISKNGCWEYDLRLRSNGYARITFENKSWYAHRLAFVAFNEIEESKIHDLDVCHICDNRKCLNPAHLFSGSRKDNMEDACIKGRQAKGFSLPQTKISDKEREHITLLAKKGIPYKEIAKNYNVSDQLIGKIAIQNGVRRR